MTDGGWILTANSETAPHEGGGASMIRFDSAGNIVDARRILSLTNNNCAGGPTPWGTWLSCEEWGGGFVHECDPTGSNPAIARPAMGQFTHEAVTVDPERECLYMTEDETDGCFDRFTPRDYPDLSLGTLEVCIVAADGAVSWAPVVPAGLPPTRYQGAALGATAFAGGEGIWFDSGTANFTTKGDKRVWAFDARASRIEVIYDPDQAGDGSPLKSVDNVTVDARTGDVYVCEDGDNFELILISPEREVASFVRLDPAVHGAPGTNETTGVVFSPDDSRMYFGVQRSFGAGAIYELSGPWRGLPSPPGGGTPPRMWVKSAIGAANLAERGLRVRLRLPEPSDVQLIPRGHGRGPVYAREASTVALSGDVALRMKPDEGAAEPLLGSEESVRAEVRATIANPRATTRLRYRVRIRPPR